MKYEYFHSVTSKYTVIFIATTLGPHDMELFYLRWTVAENIAYTQPFNSYWLKQVLRLGRVEVLGTSSNPSNK